MIRKSVKRFSEEITPKQEAKARFSKIWSDIMQTVLIIALSLHVLSAVFWAGSSFTLARTGGLGGEKLLGPQIGAATVAIVTGATLWHLVHEGSFALAEKILAAGAIAALGAIAVQIIVGGGAVRQLHNSAGEASAARSRLATAQRVAAGLLAIAALCMGAARYA